MLLALQVILELCFLLEGLLTHSAVKLFDKDLFKVSRGKCLLFLLAVMLSQFLPVFSEFLLLLESALLFFSSLLLSSNLVLSRKLLDSRIFGLDICEQVSELVVEFGAFLHALFPVILLYQSFYTTIWSVVRVVLVDVRELFECAEPRPLLVEFHHIFAA